MFDKTFISTVWSAAPTPFDENGRIDRDSVIRLADRHEQLGIRGVFIGGTCGEGPQLARAELRELAEHTVRTNAPRHIATALQITDNSAPRMIENLAFFADTGIDLAVIAPPFIAPHAECDQDFLMAMYSEVVAASPIPIGIYHRGQGAGVKLGAETVAALAALPKVVTVKDSACCADDTAVILAARDELRGRKPFYAFYGDEFNCAAAARLGYDGMMIGGGCFNGRMAARVFELARDGRDSDADALQRRLNRLMYEVFGGEDIQCWLAGEKQILVELGIFRTANCLLNYRLTAECVAAIRAAILREAEWLR